MKFSIKPPEEIMDRAEHVVQKASNSITLAVVLAGCALAVALIALVVAAHAS